MSKYMVIVSPEWGEISPDELIIIPAETYEEVESLWDHQGENTMVVGVYKEKDGIFARDTRWGMMGNRWSVEGNRWGYPPSLGFIRNENGGRNPNYRMIELGDLLTPEMFKKIEPTMKKIGSGEMDQIAGQKKILELLRPIKEELLAKGVLDEYLAYFLTYLASQMWGRP